MTIQEAEFCLTRLDEAIREHGVTSPGIPLIELRVSDEFLKRLTDACLLLTHGPSRPAIDAPLLENYKGIPVRIEPNFPTGMVKVVYSNYALHGKPVGNWKDYVKSGATESATA